MVSLANDIPPELKRLLAYDAAAGVLCWNALAAPKVRGKEVGCFSRGYRVFRFGTAPGRLYYVHRVIWELVHGSTPAKEIDHANGRRSDNRIANLREAGRREQTRNKGWSKNNTTGFRGVYRRDGRFIAKIVVDRRQVQLGTFDDPKEAAAAYLVASAKLHGEFGYAARVSNG